MNYSKQRKKSSELNELIRQKLLLFAPKLSKLQGSEKQRAERLIIEKAKKEYSMAYKNGKQLEKKGFVISGTSPDNFFVETIELPKDKHPFFFATQAHPEYKSTPWKPHPVFIEFLKASIRD